MGAPVSKIEVKNIHFHEKIGEGGFGTVKRVSFKKPYKGYTVAAAKSVLFDLGEREVEIMTQLHHPNIVTLLGICQTKAADLILMEYAPNGSLHDYLKDVTNPLPYQLQEKWAIESALALQYLHQLNYLHRDIKPQNCLLFEDNILKLCDFGLARELHGSLTTSTQKGTYRYMAPEVHVGNDQGRALYSKPSDVWAYGMLLLEICTRKPPFEHLEWHRVVFELGNGAKPSIPENCPKALSDIMPRCWESDPKERITIEDIVNELSNRESKEDQPEEEPEEPKRDAQMLVEILEIHPEHEGRRLTVNHIASCPNGDMVVASYDEIFLCSSHGKSRLKLQTLPKDDAKKQMGSVRSICVSPEGKSIMIVDDTRFVKLFNQGGKYLKSIQTRGRDGGHFTLLKSRHAAIDRQGNLLIESGNGEIIDAFSCHEGKLITEIKCKFSLGWNPSMSVNSNGEILIHSCPLGSVYSKVVAIDYSGNEVFRFTPSIDEDVSNTDMVWPGGIVCDEEDNIYVAMRAIRRGDAGHFEATGHVHMYSPTGEFLQCVAKGLHRADGLAITPERKLLVADIREERPIIAIVLKPPSPDFTAPVKLDTHNP